MDQHLFLITHDTGRDRTLDLPTLRARTADLLRAGVPLTLLLDLADPSGPDSVAAYAHEGGDARRWLRAG